MQIFAIRCSGKPCIIEIEACASAMGAAVTVGRATVATTRARTRGLVGGSATNDTADYRSDDDNDEDRDTDFNPVASATLFRSLLGCNETCGFCVVGIACAIGMIHALLATVDGVIVGCHCGERKRRRRGDGRGGE